jgi:hypothetical protein
MIGINATSHPVAGFGTVWVVARCSNDPAPIDKPSATNTTSASTFSDASTLWTRRPGPSPLTCTSDKPMMAEMATIACGVITSGASGIGTVNSGVRFAASGMNRPM